MQIYLKNHAIKIPLQDPSKIMQIYFEDIVEKNLLQYLSHQYWNQLQSMDKFEENWKQYLWKKDKNKRDFRGMKMNFLESRFIGANTF